MKISPSKEKVTYDKVTEAAENGQSIANVLEVVMDKDFIVQSRYDWFWLSWKDVPTETGWYKVDRDNQKLITITADQAAALEWHERLYVYGSGHAAVKENSPLALYIGDEYTDSRLSALYLCGPDVLTRVALKKVVE